MGTCIITGKETMNKYNNWFLCTHVIEEARMKRDSRNRGVTPKSEKYITFRRILIEMQDSMKRKMQRSILEKALNKYSVKNFGMQLPQQRN